ncbi:MAG: hypothetical protein WCQ99_14495 [Pseudomonadota bacterium]
MKLLFLGLCAGQIFCYGSLLFLGNLRNAVAGCIGVYCAAFALYLLSLAALFKGPQPESSSACQPGPGLRTRSGAAFYLAVMITIAVLARLVLFFNPPALSDDIFRYVWEGKVFSAGFNPFACAPDNPVLEKLRDASIFPGVTRKNIPTIYPPVSQFIFAACARVTPALSTMKMAFILFDLATIAVLLLTLKRLRRNPLQAAIYALNPLVIVEFAGSGHLDSAGIFFLMLSLYLFTLKKKLSPFIALAASFLVKFLPVIILPFFMRKKYLGGMLLFLVLVCTAYLPFISAGGQLFYALGIYSKHWYFNAPFYDLLTLTVSDTIMARKITAGIFILLMSGVYVWCFRRKSVPEPVLLYRASFVACGFFLLLCPTLHPWYVCWIVPFLAIIPNRAWIFLSGAVFLSYWVLKDYAAFGVWKESPLVKAIEFIPFYGLLVYDRLRSGKETKMDHYYE